jgi:ABC-type transport system involved in multi-copper enzyme maturation permease subunit
MNPGTVARIAASVFRESVRDRVLYALGAFAVLLIGVSYLIGELTAGQDVKIIKDLGLSAMSLFGVLMAVFIGVGLVWKEVEQRSVYSLLSKPVRRPELVLGKYVGLAVTLAVNVAMMTVAFYVVLAYVGATFPAEVREAWPAPATDPALLKAILLIFLELLLVTAIALLFSTYSGPFLSIVFTLGLWAIGTFNADLRDFSAVTESPVAQGLTRGLYYALPGFSAFDVKLQVVHGLAVPWSYVGVTAAYGVTYIALLLVLAMVVFSRRDFK